MANSWGHTAYRLGDAEMARRSAFSTYQQTCRAPKCQELTTHVTQYSYITGRAGRASWSSRYVCTGHAEKFATKHGIEIAAVAPSREYAMQQRAAAFRTERTTP